MQNIQLRDLIGNDFEEDFLNFNLTEIQQVLIKLQSTDALDLPHAELLQQQSLRGADILSEYLGKMVKTVSYLEGRVNSAKNKASLDYKSPDGSKTTVDMKIWYGNSAPEVDELLAKLSKAKASKMVLEKKFDILIRAHHHYKDIASGLRRTILGYNQTTATTTEKVPEGWE